ncbi:hypothetical protein K3495_g5330 [Podosphaera aphanis]|nr:hypothetical protein K3495_g5330 [Podosphaera aphanis]
MMSSSPASKLSIHAVVPSVMLDFSQTSTAAVSWELAAFMEKEVWVRLSGGHTSAGERRALLRIVNTDPNAPIQGSFVDNAVYSASQCFRLLGCWKEGKFPLSLVDNIPSVTGRIFHEKTEKPLWDFQTLVGDLATFTSTLVNPLMAMRRPWTVRLGNSFPYRNSFRIEIKRNPYLTDKMAPGVPVDKEEEPGKTTQLPHKNSAGRARTLYDTALTFDQYSVAKEFRDFEDGETCFDPFCELVNGVPFGAASARVWVSNNGSRGIFCFSCWLAVMATATWDPVPLYHEPHHIVNCGRFINAGLNRDIVLRPDVHKMQVVDAPTGSGKTELLHRLCLKYPEASILLISFRRALAVNLAERLGLTNYRDLTRNMWMAGGKDLRRVAMCVDSAKKIPEHVKYDVILVDEAGAVRRHMVNDFMGERGPEVRNSVRRLVNISTTTIITQFQLLESDVEFWASFSGLDVHNEDDCRRWVVPAQPWCPPMRWTENFEQTIWQLRRCYWEEYDEENDRTNYPIIVFCSLATHAMLLLSYWTETVAPTRRARSRVHGIWGSVQEHSFARQFLTSPNTHANECDILLVTPILQAGHSLDKWLKLSFCLLSISHLNHRDEFQFTARLRQRVDLVPYRYAYI